jgi:hypothetical protein
MFPLIDHCATYHIGIGRCEQFFRTGRAVKDHFEDSSVASESTA